VSICFKEISHRRKEGIKEDFLIVYTSYGGRDRRAIEKNLLESRNKFQNREKNIQNR